MLKTELAEILRHGESSGVEFTAKLSSTICRRLPNEPRSSKASIASCSMAAATKAKRLDRRPLAETFTCASPSVDFSHLVTAATGKTSRVPEYGLATAPIRGRSLAQRSSARANRQQKKRSPSGFRIGGLLSERWLRRY